MEKVAKWLEKNYGKGSQAIVNGIPGKMFGNDDCWDTDKFYQYFLTADKLYCAYFYLPEGGTVDIDEQNIDYSKADLDEQDVSYLLDYVIF